MYRARRDEAKKGTMYRARRDEAKKGTMYSARRDKAKKGTMYRALFLDSQKNFGPVCPLCKGCWVDSF
jgi:hypothetical protein